MLQKISDRIQGWVAGVIVAVIAAVFGLWGIEYYISRDANTSKAIVTVNGKKITEKQLNTAYQQLLRRITASQPNKSLTIPQQNQVKSLALQQLVSQSALTQAAAKTGFNVSQQQIQSMILQAPEFQVKGLFSPQRFQQFLLGIGMTEQAFLSQVESNFLVNQVAVGIEASAFVLPDDIAGSYKMIFQNRDFGYFVLPLSKFLSTVKVSDKELQDYYDKNKSFYKTPEQVQVSYLLLSPAAIEKTINVKSSELKSYYLSNKQAFTTPKQWKIMQIKVPVASTATAKQLAAADAQMQKLELSLKSGQSFAALMKQPGLKSSVRVITPPISEMVLANVLATLKPGDISQPFHTSDGVNLVKLVSVTPEKTKSFAQAQAEIKKRILRQKAQEILSKKSDDLSNLTYTNPNTLSIAAKQLNLSIHVSPLFSRNGLTKGLFSDHKLVAVAYSADVFEQGNNSNPISLSDGSIIVLRVTKRIPSKVLPFAEVKTSIQKVLTKNKAESKAGLKAYQLSADLTQGKSPQSLSKQYGFTWVMKKGVERTNKSVPMPILASVFSTAPAKGNKIAGVNTLVLANGDYVVLKVFSNQFPDLSSVASSKLQSLKQQLLRMMGGLDYRLYAKSVIKNAAVKYQINKK